VSTVLPRDFRHLGLDPRRPLPLSVSVPVTAGTFRLLFVATPADLAVILGAGLDHPWFDGDRDVSSHRPGPVDLAGALAAAAEDVFTATRPTIVVASSTGVHWARPLRVGAVQRVIDEFGRGLLFELLVGACELWSASLVRTADVGAVLTVGVRDPLAAGRAGAPPATTAPPLEEDPYVALR
jgi:hypothetical protein